MRTTSPSSDLASVNLAAYTHNFDARRIAPFRTHATTQTWLTHQEEAAVEALAREDVVTAVVVAEVDAEVHEEAQRLTRRSGSQSPNWVVS